MMIAKLSKDHIGFINQLASSGKSRSTEVSLSLGYVLAIDLILPTSCVEDITSFYNTQCKMQVRDILNTFNELFVVDRDAVLDYTIKFYQFRYNSAFPKGIVLMTSKETAIKSFFGINKSLDDNSLGVIENSPTTITNYINNLINIKKEIKNQNTEVPIEVPGH